MKEINNCICGAKAEFDWGTVSEYGGNSWQSASINCSVCDRDIDMTIESDDDYGIADKVEVALISAWNSIHTPRE